MKCANCAYDNLLDAKFCENCGQPLERTCPNCRQPVAPNAKFCRNCGYNLAANVPAKRLTDLQQSAPAALQDKIRRASTQPVGERKLVTVLFTDIVGSTALAEKLDPEEYGEIVAGAHKRVSEAVYRYEGTIAQLLGDGVLAFFGAPITHEDDPERAVNAALEIQTSVHEYAHELRDRKHIEHFRMRAGIHTGLVVAGNIGSDLHMEYLAIGDTVNLASRLQSAAEPGTILIAESTARAVRHAFDLESRGELELKGKSEPVAAYRVIARKTVAESARGIAGLDSPLVGREREFQILQTHLAELEQGRGHIIAVMGEAGLGKSRLIAEVRKSTADGRRQTALDDQRAVGGQRLAVKWLEGRSLSYQTNTPYAPFIDLFTRLFNLNEIAADKYGAIKSRLAEISDTLVDLAPFLATMLGIAPDEHDTERVKYLEPPQLRERIFLAVHTFVETLAARQPLVLVFEDLHWADPTSLGLVEQLLALTQRARVLIIALFRPQRQDPAWQFHEIASRDYAHRYTPLTLEPLNENESRTLVANLLHIEDLPEKVRALILKKAEGNPFFVEEVIRSLLDAKLVVRENEHWRATREIENIAIPDTLAGVISARLDRLDVESKHAAQTAAVIGREFQYPILAQVFDEPPALDTAVVTLQRRELIREKTHQPQIVYLFKHALTQETAYTSMLLSKRRELHRRIAECLEQTEPDRVDDIARHFWEAQAPQRALPYLIQAGNRALREYSTQEAIADFSRAVEIAETSPDIQLARGAFEGLGKALLLIGDVARVLQTYQAMLQYAQAHADAPMQVSAHNKLAFVLMFAGDFANVETNLQASEKLARAAHDKPGLVEMFTVRCGICTGTGDFDTALKYLTESAQVGRELNHKEQIAFGLTHTANTLLFMTRFDDAWAKSREALRASEDAGDRAHQAEILAFQFPFLYLRDGDLDAARKSAEEGVALSRRIGAAMPLTDGYYFLGTLARLRGEYEDAAQWFEQSLETGKQGVPMFLLLGLGSLGITLLEISPAFAEKSMQLHTQALAMMESPMNASMGGTTWADIGFCALLLNNIDTAEQLFQKGLNYPTTLGLVYRPYHLLGMTYVAHKRGKLDEAQKFVDEARAYSEERRMKHLTPEIMLASARVCAARGDYAGALEQFAQAEQCAQAMQLRPVIWHARAGAANALAQLGRAEEADAKRNDARAMVNEMASLFRDEKMRTLFLENAMNKTLSVIRDA